jgi:hypothetical protein
VRGNDRAGAGAGDVVEVLLGPVPCGACARSGRGPRRRGHRGCLRRPAPGAEPRESRHGCHVAEEGGFAPRSSSTHGPLRRSAAYSVGNWEPIAQGREPLGSEGIVPVLRDVRLHAGERTVGWRGTLAHSGAQYLFGEPHAELLGSPLCSHVGQLTVRRSAPDRGQASLSVYARCPRRGPQPLRSQSRAAALASGTVGAFGPPSPLPLTLCVSELRHEPATLTDGLLAPYL